ncbi:MAG: GNAT family N-acetyltransferase [Alphaproteobacteria bacterium]|nr:GNAT family N-acetyltransferase [Alphaproteobacteria bacterium]
MAFLRSPFAPDLPPLLRNRHVVLRTPEAGDFEAWAALRIESRAFLVPWEPAWPANDLTRSAFRARVKRYHRDIANDAAYPFFIFAAADQRLLGAVTLSNIHRGVAQMGTLGYWIGRPYARQGHMTAALGALDVFAFEHLQLHRLEAACLPANGASIGLLEKCGFQREGLARRYLKINGVWHDHFLYAKLALSL